MKEPHELRDSVTNSAPSHMPGSARKRVQRPTGESPGQPLSSENNTLSVPTLSIQVVSQKEQRVFPRVFRRGTITVMKTEDPGAFGNRLFRAEWHQTRRKGRKRFVWMMAAIWGAAFGGGYVAAQIYKGRFNTLIDSAFVMGAIAAGYFVGTKAWGHYEQKFLADTKRVNPHGQTQNVPSESN